MTDGKRFIDRYRDHLLGQTSPEIEAIEQELAGIFKRGMDPFASETHKPKTATDQDKPLVTMDYPVAKPEAVAPPTSDGAKAASEEVKKEIKGILPPEDDTLEKVLAELDELVGLDDIKQHVRTVVNLLEVQGHREKAGLPTITIGLHRLFTGNPGTGKTTVARFMGRIYKATGRLSTGQLVETDRSGLVGGFVGQTALKTMEVLESAKGGVLFLDEAYSLVPEDGGNDFGQEAITTILKFMEDNRDDFVFIGAGYPREMERFINSNSGFASRFNEILDFEDYDAQQLRAIFDGMVKKHEYVLDKKASEQLDQDLHWFIENKNANFANGRLVRKYFEAIVQHQANRLAKSKGEVSKARLKRILHSDLPKDVSALL